MKKIWISLFITSICLINASFAQQTNYDVIPGNGNGLRFWQSDWFKIHMGSGGEYQYGPVTDYSIKMNMSGEAGRGWTWGIAGQTPVAALSNAGHMQIAGKLTTMNNAKIFATAESWAEGLTIVKASGWSGIRITRNDPAGGNYNGNWAIGYNGSTGNDFSISTSYSGTQYDGLFHISNSTRNVGISTTTPRGKFDVDGPGDIYLSDDPEGTSGQSLFIPGHIYISPYAGTNISYLQARRFSNSGTTSLRLRTYYNGSLTEAMHIEGNGNVGIGTTTPGGKLDINAGGSYAIRTATTNRYVIEIKNTNDTDGGWWLVNDANGNFAIHENAVGDKFTIKAGGFVGIGTSSPDEKLTVNGTIHGTRVKVDLTVPGPDYVFEKDYNLPSLEEIKKYIDVNKRLPEAPSAKEMEKNGIDVGEMNMLLLKKVEELTLYLIDLKKENEQMKIDFSQKINALEKQIAVKDTKN